MKRHIPPGPYDLFAVLLSVAAILLVTAMAGTWDPETRRLLEFADLTLCAFFFLDFLRNLIRAEDRVRYLYTWGPLDLAASIPAIEALRLARLGRIVRVLRVLRAIRAMRILLHALRHRRRETAAWAGVLVGLLVIFTGSIVVLEVERRAGGNITTAGDALWWSFVTITTVGYGDHYPVTHAGRAVAVVLITVGVGLFGTISGMAASLFVQPVPEKQEAAS